MRLGAELHPKPQQTLVDKQRVALNQALIPFPLYTFSINAVAYAAMPSCRPTKPIRSEVVALIDTHRGLRPSVWPYIAAWQVCED